MKLRKYEEGSEGERPGHPESLFGKSGQVVRLRVLFLTPLALAILAVLVVLAYTLFQHESKDFDQNVLQIRASAQHFYDSSVQHDADALQAIMDILSRDPRLRAALADHDRQKLLELSAPVFAEIKHDFSVTHLYFIGPDRVVLVRAHTPGRFGDRINRFTMLAAQKSGTTAFGVELGPLGTFTLRLVRPWYDKTTRRLIGYVELGMEIDRVMAQMRSLLGVKAYVLIHKQFLKRRQWEAGMRTLGRTPDWGRFPDCVLAGNPNETMPRFLVKRLEGGRIKAPNSILTAMQGKTQYTTAVIPVLDAGGRAVADLVLVADVSEEVGTALRNAYASGLAAIICGTLLFGFFYVQVGYVGARIEKDERTLKALATHDGLTGLFNHRTFHALLEKEIARARRYKRPVTLFMIDLDHFKQINDTYGHPAGDAVLRELARRLASEVRKIDLVCRYGGEEITVILPETDASFDMAERLRKAIEVTPFDVGPDKRIPVTASIGAASFPKDADTIVTLISAADSALYAAKTNGRNQVRCFENNL